jgi:transposase
VENQGHCLTPFQRKLLLKRMNTDLRVEYRRRIEIMLLADEGRSQSQICAELGCSQETARYWIAMAQAGNAHKWDEHPRGRPKNVNEDYLNRLKELVSNSPRDYGYPFQRWTAQWLSKHLAKEMGIEVSDRHINRLLKEMGLSTRKKQQEPQPIMNELDEQDSSITIGDLPSASSPNFLWLFNSRVVISGSSQ